MKAYLDLLQYILENGEEKSDRTNTGNIAFLTRLFDEDEFEAMKEKIISLLKE